MIELRISWKALLFAALFYWLSKDSEVLEAVKKNTVNSSDGTREDRINRRHEMMLTEFDQEYYSTLGEVAKDYEQRAQPIRTFTR